MAKESSGLIVAVLLALLTNLSSAEIVNSDLVIPKDNGRNISLSDQMKVLLDYFNNQRLVDNWLTISEKLSPNCSLDMEHYLQGLSEHAMWALKSAFVFRLMFFCCNTSRVGL